MGGKGYRSMMLTANAGPKMSQDAFLFPVIVALNTDFYLQSTRRWTLPYFFGTVATSCLSVCLTDGICSTDCNISNGVNGPRPIYSADDTSQFDTVKCALYFYLPPPPPDLCRFRWFSVSICAQPEERWRLGCLVSALLCVALSPAAVQGVICSPLCLFYCVLGCTTHGTPAPLMKETNAAATSK